MEQFEDQTIAVHGRRNSPGRFSRYASCPAAAAAAWPIFRCQGGQGVRKPWRITASKEVWYFLAGRGRFWRKEGLDEDIVEVSEGVSISIPPGTHFQFRNDGEEALAAVGVSMPPWPGEAEAYPVEGLW